MSTGMRQFPHILHCVCLFPSDLDMQQIKAEMALQCREHGAVSLPSCKSASEESACGGRLAGAPPAARLHLRVEVCAGHLPVRGVAYVRLQPEVVQVTRHGVEQQM